MRDLTAIEAKAKEDISTQDLLPLRALAEERMFKRYICIRLASRARTVDGVSILPYRKFPDDLWSGTFTCFSTEKKASRSAAYCLKHPD